MTDGKMQLVLSEQPESSGGNVGWVRRVGFPQHSVGYLCTKLSRLDVKLDEQATHPAACAFFAPDGGVSVWVIPTNEALMITQHTLALARP